MSKTAELRLLNGVRNDIPLERFDRDDDGKYTGKIDLSAAVNCDLDETGKIFRRLGTHQLASGTAHSLFAGPDYAYYVLNNSLKCLDKSLTATAVTTVNEPLDYVWIADHTYWSNTGQCGMLSGATNLPWGITPPPAFDAVEIPGMMRPGRYLYAMTYVRSTGEESGAVKCGEIVTKNYSGISFPSLPVSSDPLVTTKRIYLSGVNAEVPMLAGVFPNATTTATFEMYPTLELPLRTQFMGPPDPGQVLGYLAGRAFVAKDRYLQYSLPYEYSLFDKRSGFASFPSTVRTFAAVSDGVYIGTDRETFWCAGTDPTQWVLHKIAPYGTVRGTEVSLRNDLIGQQGVAGNAIGWMGHKGFCMGFDGGTMQEVTGGRFIPPIAAEGASLLKIRSGTPQIVTTLYN